MPAKSSKNRRARWFVLAVATTLIANSTQQGSGQDWVRLIPAGNLPEGRVGATSVHDPIENSMILFAGHNNIGNCVPVACSMMSGYSRIQMQLGG